MYWPLTGAFMNVSAVTLRLLLIITAYMDDLLHEDTNIFFLSITRIFFSHGYSRVFFFVPNYRIFEFLSSHGVSRIVTVFLLYPEFSNYRILSSHGISRTVTDFLFLFLSRIIELSNFCLHTEYREQSRVSSSHGISRKVTGFFFTRSIADGHGFSFFFLSRIIETCPWTH